MCGSPPSRRRAATRGGRSSGRRAIQLLEPGIDLAREHLHALDGLLVVEEARLAHHEELAEASDVVVHANDLAVDGVGIAREEEAVLHEPLERGVLEHLVDAWPRDLAFVAEKEPATSEDPFEFLLVDLALVEDAAADTTVL